MPLNPSAISSSKNRHCQILGCSYHVFTTSTALAIAAVPITGYAEIMRDETPQNSDNLRLAEVSEHIGAWEIHASNASPCHLDLKDTPVESANAYALDDRNNCLAAVIGAPVAGWRPVPDGIDFVAANRLTLIHFDLSAPHRFVARAPGGAFITLARAPAEQR